MIFVYYIFLFCFQSTDSTVSSYVPMTPTETPPRSHGTGPRTRSMTLASPGVSSPLLPHPMDSPQEDIKVGSEHDIQRFIPEAEDEEDEEELAKSESEMSLTESDLMSLFTAADAMDSRLLQSHLHSLSDSSCSQSLGNIPEHSVPPSPIPSTSSSVAPDPADEADPYDYNNYAPGFANKYRTPVRMSRQDSIDSVFEESDSPVKKRHSYVVATQASDQEECALVQEVESEETEVDSDSINNKR